MRCPAPTGTAQARPRRTISMPASSQKVRYLASDARSGWSSGSSSTAATRRLIMR